jgi:hypothetical protein
MSETLGRDRSLCPARQPQVPTMNLEHAQQSGEFPVQIAVETGPHAGTVVTWQQQGSYLIGRAGHAHLALIHDIVASLEHCRLTIDEHGCLVRDLGGRQGTALNGRSISQSPVRSGDVLEVGMSRLRIKLGGAIFATTSLASGQRPPLGATAAFAPRAEAVQGVLDIPGYTIVRKLGEGGMGVVYEASRRDTGERVAIKTIIPAPGTAQRSIQLFRREMKLLAQLEHPRIVRFIDSGEHAGQLFLVMDYVECVDLKAAVSPLTPKRRIDVYCGIACQVLEALEYAHERKLVHRDVKPVNILISRSGRRLYAKLADFGLAKNFEMAGLSQLTADNELRGTLAFMPWEQLRNSRYAKPAVDIYSIAATLYYYLTGHAPGYTTPGDAAPRRGSLLGITSLFRGAGRSATGPPAAAPACDFSSIPEELAKVLSKALSSEPKQRYATASAMREAIMSYSRGKQ